MLYDKYRPATLDEVVGQERAVKVLEGYLKKDKFPHSVLLSGPSGCGKTTLARIVARKLGAQGGDLVEVDCGDFRGLDTVREIRRNSKRMPLSGKAVVYIVDEAHRLTMDAQSAMLKITENPPAHVYFLLCTTEPHRLLKTIRSRFADVKVDNLNEGELATVISEIISAEKAKICEDVQDKIVELAEGSARRAIVLLDQVLDIEGDDEQMEVLQKTDLSTQAIEIARLLFRFESWSKIVKAIKEIDDEPEGLRRMILGYATTILLGGGKLADRAFLVIETFRDNWYDSGKAGLAASCYAVCKTK